MSFLMLIIQSFIHFHGYRAGEWMIRYTLDFLMIRLINREELLRWFMQLQMFKLSKFLLIIIQHLTIIRQLLLIIIKLNHSPQALPFHQNALIFHLFKYIIMPLIIMPILNSYNLIHLLMLNLHQQLL
jgi:hypothetical protein